MSRENFSYGMIDMSLDEQIPLSILRDKRITKMHIRTVRGWKYCIYEIGKRHEDITDELMDQMIKEGILEIEKLRGVGKEMVNTLQQVLIE